MMINTKYAAFSMNRAIKLIKNNGYSDMIQKKQISDITGRV